MDEVKILSKAKHEERTQRHAELDEFYRNQRHRFNRWPSEVPMTHHRKFRTLVPGNSLCVAESSKEIQVSPEFQWSPKISIGAIVRGSSRDNVRMSEHFLTAPVDPMPIKVSIGALPVLVTYISASPQSFWCC